MNSIKSLAKSVAYGALNLSTAGRGVKRIIGGEPVRFPARWSRYYLADYEAATFDFLRAHCAQGHDVLDMGAHIGLFTVVMARLVGPTGRVFSFEPTPLTREVLRETVRLNGCEGIVEVREEAMAKVSGSATFYDTGDAGSNANSLVPTQRSQSGYTVRTVSLDDFTSSRGLPVGCLKIDVEGAELDVLLGGERTFLVSRPAVWLALHPPFLGDSAKALAEIWKILQQYRMLVSYQGGRVEEDWFREQRELFDVQLLPH